MRKIKLTEMEIRTTLEEAAKKILAASSIPNEFKIATNPNIKLDEKDKIHLIFSETAEKKMHYLIECCSKEVGWHGLVERVEEGFLIEDIIVFPQEVTSSTVVSDDEKYTKWLLELENDVYNKVRFHGHSHVNMGTTPSLVDTTYQETLLSQFTEGFYIFGIFNKKGDYWLNIYDFDKNILYDKDDIVYEYYEVEEKKWAKEQIKEKLTERTYTSNSGWTGRHWRSQNDKSQNTPPKDDKKKDEAKEITGWETMVSKTILDDLTPPKTGSKWSVMLERYILASEKIDDLIMEFYTPCNVN